MKNLLFILTISALFLLQSCEDFIDLKPRDQISVESYWQTATDLENYVVQFYSQLPSPNMVHEEQNSDNMIQHSASSIMDGERTKRTGQWTWEWNDIRDINIFFDNYRKCEDAFDSYKHYVGEAHFFRAWFYFDLLKRYGDLPWISSELEINSDKLMAPREPRTLIADSILADLNKAISYLDTRAEVGNARINKEAALAFKTRVALFEGSWQKYHADDPFGTEGADPDKYFQECVDAAEELMNGGNYKVGIYNTGNPNEDYYRLFGMTNMDDINEVLFYKAYNLDEDLGAHAQYYTIGYSNSAGVTWSLVSSYLGRDGEPYNYLNLAETTKGNNFLEQIAQDVDPRLKQTIWIPGDIMNADIDKIFEKPLIDGGALELCPTGFRIKKTSDPNRPGTFSSWADRDETGYIYFRYAEVLLNYAEAKYELDNTVAYDKLNILRRRAGMPDFAIISQSSDPNLVDYGYSISDELYEIRRERRIELALEGEREEDYMRWAAHSLFKGERPKGYPYKTEEWPDYQPPLDENGLIDYYKDELPNGYEFREDQDYLYSIPQDELTLNPNLDQNPGWGE